MKFFFAIISALLLIACADTAKDNNPACSKDSQTKIEQLIGSSDGHGHGPDIGSDEWHSVIEFKLGVRGQQNLPQRHSQSWCDFILTLENSQ